MKRKLINQIGNEWRSNLWLTIEMLIVSVVLWYIVDYIYTKFSIVNEPRGFNTEHCYLISFDCLSEKSPEFIADRSIEDRCDEFVELADRLRHRPEIEYVSYSNNSHPYNFNTNGTYMQTDTFSTADIFCLQHYVTPDYVKVFQIHGSRGETPEQLAELLADEHNFIISDNTFNHKYGIPSMRTFVGKEFSNASDGDTLRLAATVNLRYSDYQASESGLSIMIRGGQEQQAAMNWMEELCVRVRADMDSPEFIDNLMSDAPKELRVGNTFIASAQSFDEIRDNFHKRDDTDLRNMSVGMGFLMLNIFLGLLGSFWFRTQQRVAEVAIRKVNGATKSAVFRRFIGEGLLLLTIVTPIAAVIDITIAHFELNSFYNWAYLHWPRMIACIAITFALMSLMIVLGIFIPARRAMRIEPATALHDE